MRNKRKAAGPRTLSNQELESVRGGLLVAAHSDVQEGSGGGSGGTSYSVAVYPTGSAGSYQLNPLGLVAQTGIITATG